MTTSGTASTAPPRPGQRQHRPPGAISVSLLYPGATLQDTCVSPAMERPARNLPPPRLTGWRSWTEWQAVCDKLASPAAHVEAQRWIARGRAPHAVHCTAQLAELAALDGTLNDDDPACSDSKRLAYAAALLRLVNGATDAGQGAATGSVYELAARIGLPRPLVDVRHEAAHGALPSLALLRGCAVMGQSWLAGAYWTRQAAHLRGHANASSLDAAAGPVTRAAAPAALPGTGVAALERWCASPTACALRDFADAVHRGDVSSRSRAALAVSTLISQCPPAGVADAAAMRLAIVLPLMDPGGRGCPAHLGDASPQLLLDAAARVGADTLQAQWALLRVWLPLLNTLSQAWHWFSVALAAASAGAVAAALSEPEERADEAAAVTVEPLACRARFALLILRLLVSSTWASWNAKRKVDEVRRDPIETHYQAFAVAAPPVLTPALPSELLPAGQAKQPEASCLAGVLRDFSRMLIVCSPLGADHAKDAALRGWRAEVHADALALSLACGASVSAAAARSCVLSRRQPWVLRRRRGPGGAPLMPGGGPAPTPAAGHAMPPRAPADAVGGDAVLQGLEALEAAVRGF